MKKLLILLTVFNALLFADVNIENNTSKADVKESISFGFYRVIEKSEKEDNYKLLEWYDKPEERLKLFSIPILTQEMIESATVGFERYSNTPLINIQLNKEGTEIFGIYTATHTMQRLAIVVDDKVYTAPTIREAISGGFVQIAGNFTAPEAQVLVDGLNN